MITIRDSSLQDVELLCGGRPYYNMHAKTIEKDGQPVCVAGVFFMPDTIIAFSDFKECDVPKMTMYRYSQKIMEFITSLKLPVEVKADVNNPKSAKFLESMGFRFKRNINNESWYVLKH